MTMAVLKLTCSLDDILHIFQPAAIAEKSMNAEETVNVKESRGLR